uniref:Uncharacterized protein n=1 Tax=Macrostomum lignano TaxID=282301 RepID=A0A1I8IEG8_9PLAT
MLLASSAIYPVQRPARAELAPTRPNGVSSSGQLTSPTTTTVAAMMKEFADSAEAAGPPGPPKQSDNESVRTEDFANKFSQLMQPEGSTAGSKSRPGVGGDAESIRTEDFAREFRKTLVPPAGGSEWAISVAILVVYLVYFDFSSMYYFCV